MTAEDYQRKLGMLFLKGSEEKVIETTSDIFYVFTHKDKRRVMVYNGRSKKIIKNIEMDRSLDFDVEYQKIVADLGAIDNNSFTHPTLNVGDVLESHTSDRFENNIVNFYQILAINTGHDGGFPLVTYVQIEKSEKNFENYKKAVPLIGCRKQNSEELSACVIQNTIKLSDGRIAFRSKFNILELTKDVKVKIYEPVSYGLVI